MMYTYETIPIHPRPLPVESLTSYITRLGQANCVQSVDAVCQLFYPSQDRRVTREVSDYSTLNLGELAIVSASTEAELLATTFFHFSRKFGRSTHPQALSRFLSGIISKQLRYCPLCIAESRYYSLLWRLKPITRCTKHGCQLLDCCYSCGSPIPLFKSPLRIGYCHTCQHDLGSATFTSLTETDKPDLARIHNEFEYLVSLQAWETDQSVVFRLGRVFADRRLRIGITGENLAQALGVSLSSIEGLERGNTQNRGANFEVYLKYAHYLQVSLPDLFAEALDRPP